ncbi:hypothetical protein JTE90_028236 [Oedothorax gibbosus]|uniref:Uncharacterized protein n=1 Tax=Oedothorax gibbosus TaxID=931172 RepID=A0AAV6TTQ1_9ARAC|nr:hypothetical protein JTE90_028236 [Oedothorax gibbosus]
MASKIAIIMFLVVMLAITIQSFSPLSEDQSQGEEIARDCSARLLGEYCKYNNDCCGTLLCIHNRCQSGSFW